MKQFKEFGIETPVITFEGDKISPENVLNKDITVIGYKIEDSKFKEKGNGKCLNLQIEYKGEKRVMFSGSGYLMAAIQKVGKDDFPFTTVIIKKNKSFQFS